VASNKDKEFDQFLKSKMGRPKDPPAGEWQTIHGEIFKDFETKSESSFLQFWPAVLAAVFSLSLVVYNYSFYNSSEVDDLLNISFSTDQSWSSSTALVNFSSDDNI